MNGLDIGILIFLIFGIIQGFRRGFVIEITSLIAMVVGVVAAFHYESSVAKYLVKYTSWDENTTYLLSLILVFLAVVIALSILGRFITKVLNVVMLGMVNKLLGGVFGFFKMAFMLSVLFFIDTHYISLLPFVKESDKETSSVYKSVSKIAPYVVPKALDEIDKAVKDTDYY